MDIWDADPTLFSILVLCVPSGSAVFNLFQRLRSGVGIKYLLILCFDAAGCSSLNLDSCSIFDLETFDHTNGHVGSRVGQLLAHPSWLEFFLR